MPKKIFISYSHRDAERLDRLHKHLAQLKREGSIEAWYDREITAGARLNNEISHELEISDIFLAILSPDFLASSYCQDIELKAALEREGQGTLTVVPIIFEPCDWQSSELGELKAIPNDGKAVSEFSNETVALLSIVSELRRLISAKPKEKQSTFSESAGTASQPNLSQSSRYRIRRDFDQIDKRDYISRAFNDIQKFFQDSVSEIFGVPEVDAEFLEVDRDSCSCTIINRGLGRAYETITVRKSGSFGDIDLVYGTRPSPNTSNGSFSVQNDNHEMYLSGSSFSLGHSQRERLTPSGAAKLMWDDLLRKVGIDYA